MMQPASANQMLNDSMQPPRYPQPAQNLQSASQLQPFVGAGASGGGGGLPIHSAAVRHQLQRQIQVLKHQREQQHRLAKQREELNTAALMQNCAPYMPGGRRMQPGSMMNPQVNAQYPPPYPTANGQPVLGEFYLGIGCHSGHPKHSCNV